MVIEQSDQSVVTRGPTTAGGQQTVRTDVQRTTRPGPGGPELIRRIVVLAFGLIQLVIGMRIVLLLLNAREGNDLVAAIVNVSQPFVAPFNGIFGTDAVHASGSTLDVTAIVAFVGWTMLELVIIWAVGIFRRAPA